MRQNLDVMADKKSLIKFCRYYKGEDKNPFNGKDQMKSLMWEYECKWVEFTIKASEDENGQEAKVLSSVLSDYIRVGLREFENMDDTPISLKAILYNRYYYWNEGGDFTKWYKEVYMQ